MKFTWSTSDYLAFRINCNGDLTSDDDESLTKKQKKVVVQLFNKLFP